MSDSEQPVDMAAIAHTIYAEIFRIMGKKSSPWLRRFLQFLLSPAVNRVTKLAFHFDQDVARLGLPGAFQLLLPRFVDGYSVTGADFLDLEGPLLIASNHPAAYDLPLIVSCLKRQDIKIITSEIPSIQALPATYPHVLSIGRAGSKKMNAARAGIRHLAANGALLIFPSGLPDPDPAFMSGAAEALDRWSPSVELFLRHVPETKLVLAIVSGVLSKRWYNHWFVRRWERQIDRQRIAEFFQIAQQMLFPQSLIFRPAISFAAPISLAQISGQEGQLLEQTRTCALDLLKQHYESFIR